MTGRGNEQLRVPHGVPGDIRGQASNFHNVAGRCICNVGSRLSSILYQLYMARSMTHVSLLYEKKLHTLLHAAALDLNADLRALYVPW